MDVKTRYFLSSKKIKLLLKEIEDDYPFLKGKLNYKNSKVEIIESHSKLTLYIINGVTDWFRKNKKLIPTISFFLHVEVPFPKITIDMGAVPYISKGADVMAPGVVYFPEEIYKNQIVKITDEKYDKPIAVGKTLVSGLEFKEIQKGKIALVLHHVGDEIWALVKSLNL